MKKMLSFALAFTLALGIFAGCGGGSGSTAASGGTAASGNAAASTADAGATGDKVTLTYLSRYANPEEPRSQFYMGKLQEFLDENPNVVIEDMSVSDGDAYISKIKSSIAAGNPPDLFISDSFSSLLDLVETGMVQDISGLIESPEWTGPSDPDVLAPFTYGAQGIEGVYGVPNQVVTEQMFVNKKLLEENGFEVPETWEDIIAMVPTFEEQGIAPVGLGSKIPYRAGALHTAIYLKMFGPEFMERYQSGELKWTDPDSLAVLEKYAELVNAGVFGPDDVAMDDLTLIEEFIKGNYPMAISPSFFFSLYQNAENAGDFVCINIPYFADKPEFKDNWNSSTQEGFVVSAAPGTPEYDAATKLLTKLLSKETFTEYAELLGGGVFPLDVEFDATKADPIMQGFMDAYASRTGVGDDIARASKNTGLLPVFWSETQSLFVGRTPQEVADTLQKEDDKAQ